MTGAHLRRRRQALGLSQTALAERLGVPQATISRWETGGHAIDQPEILDLAIRALETERDIQRYRRLLADELQRLALTEDEALLICDALNGVWVDESSYRLVGTEILDAIQHDNLHIKWQVADLALAKRLAEATPGQSLALVDAVERFWREAEDVDDTRELVRRVGLATATTR